MRNFQHSITPWQEPSRASAPNTPGSMSFGRSPPSNLVKVICRLRPRLPSEEESERPVVQVISHDEIRIIDPVKKLVNRFDFSACYGESSTQEEIFDREVRDMVLGVFIGVTASIFTFGCTGSGKTFTLQGSPHDPGITPRAVKAIFDHKDRLASNSVQKIQYTISVSCFEIWKDKVWDLLADNSLGPGKDHGRGDLPIREGSNGQIFIPNLRNVIVTNVNEFERLYEKFAKARATASTKLNHVSSRSHAIINLQVTQVSDGVTTQGKCVLIDLAGSENNKKTGNEESRERMKESVEINQSLLTLRKVVRALNAGENRIPYRDSKLTRILSDCLGGSSASLVICNVASSALQYRDTMNTLTFGSLSRNVENKVAESKPAMREKESLQIEPLSTTVSFYQHLAKSAPNLPLLHSNQPSSQANMSLHNLAGQLHKSRGVLSPAPRARTTKSPGNATPDSKSPLLNPTPTRPSHQAHDPISRIPTTTHLNFDQSSRGPRTLRPSNESLSKSTNIPPPKSEPSRSNHHLLQPNHEPSLTAPTTSTYPRSNHEPLHSAPLGINTKAYFDQPLSSAPTPLMVMKSKQDQMPVIPTTPMFPQQSFEPVYRSPNSLQSNQEQSQKNSPVNGPSGLHFDPRSRDPSPLTAGYQELQINPGVQIPNYKGRARRQALQALSATATPPLVIKKKSTIGSNPNSPSLSLESNSSSTLDEASEQAPTQPIVGAQDPVQEIEKKVNEFIERNMDGLVQKRIEELIEVKFQGVQSLLIQKDSRPNNEDEELLLQRITNLEQQFMRISNLLTTISPPRQLSDPKIPTRLASPTWKN